MTIVASMTILQGHFRPLPNRIGPAMRNSRGGLSARIGHRSSGRATEGWDSVSGTPKG